MEYLVLAGNGLHESLSRTLGEYAPFFWAVVAPAGLAVLWIGSVFALWQTWSRQKSDGEEGAGVFLRLVFSLVMVVLVLGSGTGLEYLLLGDGHLHSRVLGIVLDLVRSL
jgi:hypothetical protein